MKKGQCQDSPSFCSRLVVLVDGSLFLGIVIAPQVLAFVFNDGYPSIRFPPGATYAAAELPDESHFDSAGIRDVHFRLCAGVEFRGKIIFRQQRFAFGKIPLRVEKMGFIEHFELVCDANREGRYLAWYTAVTAAIAKRRRFLNDRLYRRLIWSCASVLLVFASYFFYTGLNKAGLY